MEAIIKIGGSLLGNSSTFKKLLYTINDLAKQHSIVIVPGGGTFADLVREFHTQYGFSNTTAHKMAIMSEDIVGILIGEYLKNGIFTKNLNEISNILKRLKIPILLPSKILLELDELPHSWDVTSDSISIYLAHKLNISTVILVKDVDGLYTADPKKNSNAQLIQFLKAEELKKFKDSCVDKALSNFISKYNISSYLINGYFPVRIQQILNGQNTICSLITP